MERLTNREPNGSAYFPRCFEEPCGGGGCEMQVCDFSYQVCDRLAAYEETGLEPEEIKDFTKRWKRWERIASLCEQGGINHLFDLKRAERDGRLVVLPIPVGTGKVAYGFTDPNARRRPDIVTIECDRLDGLEMWDNPSHEVVIEVDGWEIGKSDIGKTVFLTREEAEAAIARNFLQDGREKL